MKHIFLWILLSMNCLLYSGTTIDEAETITYEVLAASDWTDHVRSFKELFSLIKIKSFLELGCGRGTKFFLDNCESVTSVELVVSDLSDKIVPWYYATQGTLYKYTNWNPSLHIFSLNVTKANGTALKELDPELFDKSYLPEIDQLMSQIFSKNRYDVAFVDPGIHIRGDLVNALFGRCDIIAAHDTNFNGKTYGWYKFKNHPDYEKIVSTYGSGITFWIKKSKVDLIQKLKNKLPQRV